MRKRAAPRLGGRAHGGEPVVRDSVGAGRAPLEQALLTAHDPDEPPEGKGLAVSGRERLPEVFLVPGLDRRVHRPLPAGTLHDQRARGEGCGRVRPPAAAEPRDPRARSLEAGDQRVREVVGPDGGRAQPRVRYASAARAMGTSGRRDLAEAEGACRVL